MNKWNSSAIIVKTFLICIKIGMIWKEGAAHSFWKYLNGSSRKHDNAITCSDFVPYRKPQGAALMFPLLSAFLEQSGYYRLEAHREFIKSHTDYEQCESLAFRLFWSLMQNQDVFSLAQSAELWIGSTGSKTTGQKQCTNSQLIYKSLEQQEVHIFEKQVAVLPCVVSMW